MCFGSSRIERKSHHAWKVGVDFIILLCVVCVSRMGICLVSMLNTLFLLFITCRWIVFVADAAAAISANVTIDMKFASAVTIYTLSLSLSYFRLRCLVLFLLYLAIVSSFQRLI